MQRRLLDSVCRVFVLFSALALGGAAAQAQAPRNVILMIGDGMGPEHVELARRALDSGGRLAMDTLDYRGSLTTNTCLEGEITDSAAAATALATGKKTYYGAVSMVPPGDDCPHQVPIDMAHFVHAETVLERAEANGKVTGIVSSVFLVDATPGAWAAHTVSRYDYGDIATQQARAGVEVLLGAGRSYYLPQGAYGTGGPDLIDELTNEENPDYRGYDYVRRDRELDAIDPVETDKLLGFFGGVAMTYALNRDIKKNLTEPALAQMVRKTLDILSESSRSNDGFFLVVEGGGIDWVAHKLDAAGTLRDVQAFDAAVLVARNFALADGNTLLVVTADHETGGLKLPEDPADLDMDFLEGVRATTDIIWDEIEGGMSVDRALKTYAGINNLSRDERQSIESCADDLGISDVLNARAGVSWGWSHCKGGHHTDTDVPLFATGPGADYFQGTLDNTDIGKQLLVLVSGQ